jgi:4-carboxymuconolactone decarboxylase
MRRFTATLSAAVLLAGASTYIHAQAPTQPAPPSQPSRAQQLMGDIAPKLAELTDSVLFGDVWERPGLSKRDRSLVTVSALIAMNRPEQLRSHIALARRNGVTETEIVEAIKNDAVAHHPPHNAQRNAMCTSVSRPRRMMPELVTSSAA